MQNKLATCFNLYYSLSLSMADQAPRQVVLEDHGTRVTITVEGNDVYYEIEDAETIINFSICQEVFRLLRLAEDEINPRSEGPASSDPESLKIAD